jgi:hypothetical protein
MKTTLKFIIPLFLFVFTGTAHAQDFAEVDNIVKAYPKSFSNIDKLAGQISQDFKNDEEKARAIYTWIAHTIKYDNSPAALGRKPIKFSYRTEEERRAKIAEIENDLAQRTLTSKKGVCHGYAMLYTVVARKLGLQSEVVHGNAKSTPDDIGKLPNESNHAWNVVKVNGKWKHIDVTWGAGGITNGSKNFTFKFDDNYFFTDPDQFFLNHFPADKKWLLTNKSESEYAALPLYMSLGYEFLNPVKGIVKAGSGTLPFKVKGLKSTDRIVYQYTSGPFSQKVTPKVVNGVGEFNITLDKTAKGSLFIFVNGESIAAYKIN